jgi:hypothetical protein
LRLDVGINIGLGAQKPLAGVGPTRTLGLESTAGGNDWEIFIGNTWRAPGWRNPCGLGSG